jgi:hypothetical protein
MGEQGMDVRVRWLLLEKPMPWFMLELLVCLLVMGTMILAAARGVPRTLQHLYVLDAVFQSSAGKIDMMEFRAVTGAWPTSALALPKSLAGTEVIREGGAVDYTLSARAGNAAGKIVTFRAWQNSGAAGLPVAWLCGLSRAVPLTASGTDMTTLTDDELPSLCRARR